ncbi:MAG: UDP-N-acetylmuramoyl-L-alanine--D-glutamate ligase [Acidimicrobiia bacterium]
MTRTLVYGLAIAGRAVATSLVKRGHEVIAADDKLTEDSRYFARQLGIETIDKPPADRIEHLVRSVDQVAPSPGIPENHPLIRASWRAGKPLRTEIDLAAEFEADRRGGPRPFLAITGTDGKTTVTTLVTAIMNASGWRAEDVGNTDLPLITAIDDDSLDVFVVECASFRLRWIDRFAPKVGTWLNLAPDHLNWHPSIEAYADAKARIWEHQQPSDVAVAFADDPVVMAHARAARSRLVTFGTVGDYHERSGRLFGPYGELLDSALLFRNLPHDRTNALAAAATALESGLGTLDGVQTALMAFRGIPHRIALVANAGGISWYDDSKATTPHAAVAAMRGFDSVVLIAGGRNKDLDLRALTAAAAHVRAVVAIGDSAGEIEQAFRGMCPVVKATSMDAAVSAAADLARPGDAVVLSPGCTSFDWYNSYGERGDDFIRAVRFHLGVATSEVASTP